jgi:hypothetical protein
MLPRLAEPVRLPTIATPRCRHARCMQSLRLKRKNPGSLKQPGQTHLGVSVGPRSLKQPGQTHLGVSVGPRSLKQPGQTHLGVSVGPGSLKQPGQTHLGVSVGPAQSRTHSTTHYLEVAVACTTLDTPAALTATILSV